MITTRRSAWSPLSWATSAFWALILAAIAFCLASASDSSSPVATGGALEGSTEQWDEQDDDHAPSRTAVVGCGAG